MDKGDGMEWKRYRCIAIVLSVIATTSGTMLVLFKLYSHIGIVLLSFGGLALAHFMGLKRGTIMSDELTEWISGKSAHLSFLLCWATIVILLALDIYDPTLVPTYIALGIVMGSLVISRIAGEYYYGKVREEMGPV